MYANVPEISYGGEVVVSKSPRGTQTSSISLVSDSRTTGGGVPPYFIFSIYCIWKPSSTFQFRWGNSSI